MEPTIMFVRVSENCNAGCFMCDFAHTHNSYNITDEEFEKLINLMHRQGTYKMIRFTGGEPLLHKNLPNFIKKSKEEGYLTSVITNGYLLPYTAKELVDSGLDQVIISIDGSKGYINDELRGLKNGLNHIIEGVKKIREYNPDILIRANTVISDKNIDDLLDLYILLEDLEFDFWSIIPIRGNNAQWKKEELLKYKEIFNKFKEKQQSTEKPELLGYSNVWAGTNDEEVEKTFTQGFRGVPKDKCHLVDLVRFYIPNKNLLVPCNCAAHRIEQIETEYKHVSGVEEKADLMAEWLKINGPTHCTGCEPVNAYYGDKPLCLKKDIFKY